MASSVCNLRLLLLIIFIWRVKSELIEAECVIEANSGKGPVAGTVYFTQPTTGDIEIRLALTSVGDNATEHGFHIHENGALTQECTDAGGHYNPTDEVHGAPTDEHRHVGDLGNIVVDEDGNVNTFMTDGLVKLSGDQSVIGKAVVVHADIDDLGQGNEVDSNTTGHAGARQGCCVITKTYPPDEPLEKDIVAECEILATSGVSTYNVTGNVTFTYPKEHGETSIKIVLEGLKPDSKHGFHIHETGDLGDECSAAGGHYNPAGLDHGAPDVIVRHVGDLGNIESNADGEVSETISDRLVRLIGDTSVLNKAVVVHADEDDLGLTDEGDSLTTGHAGARIGCCVIKKDTSPSGAATVMLTPITFCLTLLMSAVASLQ